MRNEKFSDQWSVVSGFALRAVLCVLQVLLTHAYR